MNKKTGFVSCHFLLFSICYCLLLSVCFADDDYDIYDSSSVGVSDNADYSNYYGSGSKGKKNTKSTNNNFATSNSNNSFTIKKDKNNFPNMQGEVLTEYHFSSLGSFFSSRNSNNYKVNPDDKRNDSYLYSTAQIGLNFNEYFYMLTDWQISPVNKRLNSGKPYADLDNYVVAGEGQDSLYMKENYIERKTIHTNDYGLGVNSLNFNFKNSNLALGGGKFEASFATGYSKNRFMGINGTLLTDEYKLDNVLGGYVAALLPFGKLQFNAFYKDNTKLSNTTFKKTGQDKSTKEAGYNGKANNFSVSLDIKNNDTIWNAGFRYLQPGADEQIPLTDRKFTTEKGYTLSAEKLYRYNNGINFIEYVELAYFDNYEGIDDRYAVYGTLNLGMFFENWRFITSGTYKKDKWGDGGNKRNLYNYIGQVSVGYVFNNGLMFDISQGWIGREYRFIDIASNGTDYSVKRYSKSGRYSAIAISYLFEF